ncbi:helix-turn-helix domain-containing protein [Streptomyces sp. NPDC018026]|uniref:helix-turn-helix domain-containing protein n=1 Tax=Streptomyces sp. NPDC018026 TaxID=3365031 RepID=UPI0037B95267
MTLRIHFTADDLARTTVAAGPDPMWELVSSLHRLQSARSGVRHRRWLRHVHGRLHSAHSGSLREALGPLTRLVPRRGDFPDFLTPQGGGDFAAALDRVAATPGHRVRRELAGAFRGRRAPGWIRRLAADDRACRRELRTALTVYYREVLRPHLPEIGETVLAERALCGRSVVDGGVGALLSTLAPSIRWAAPLLSTDYPSDRDVFLRGRGITLIPSFFCVDTPVALIDPELPPVLVYPVTAGAGPQTAVPEGLAALLGRTRARAVRALAHPRSTTELARRLGVSAGTASRHATALREAGLVVSARRGNTMLHVVTELGRDLDRSRSV